DIRNGEVALGTARRLLAEAEQRATAPVKAGESAAKPTLAFATTVGKVFNKKCRSCHGGIGASAIAKSGLTLTSADGALRGGWKHGPAIVPGDSRSSPLVRYIKGELTPRMPLQGDPVTSEELN